MGSTQRFSPRSFRIPSHSVPKQPRWLPSRPATPCAKRLDHAPVALDVHAADQVLEARSWSVRFSPSGCSPLRPFLRLRALKRLHTKRRGELLRSTGATHPGSIRTRRALPPPQRSSCLSTTILLNACIIKGSRDDFATRGHLLQSEGLKNTGRKPEFCTRL